MRYRKLSGSTVWHFVPECQHYPEAGREGVVSETHPEGMRPKGGTLCDECQAKERNADESGAPAAPETPTTPGDRDAAEVLADVLVSLIRREIGSRHEGPGDPKVDEEIRASLVAALRAL